MSRNLQQYRTVNNSYGCETGNTLYGPWTYLIDGIKVNRKRYFEEVEKELKKSAKNLKK